MSFQYDLVVLVADADAEWALRTLLESRAEALGIRTPTSKVIRDPGRDAGVFLRAHDLLRSYTKLAAYALVLLDREGSGQEQRQTASEMEADLEDRLGRAGWLTEAQQPRAAAIVLDPELEVWVWSRSPHVPEVLGLEQERLARLLERCDREPNGKPTRPKEALLAALHEARKPHSPAIYRELAQTVSLQAHERAFDKLRSTLQAWFPTLE